MARGSPCCYILKLVSDVLKLMMRETYQRELHSWPPTHNTTLSDSNFLVGLHSGVDLDNGRPDQVALFS